MQRTEIDAVRVLVPLAVQPLGSARGLSQNPRRPEEKSSLLHLGSHALAMLLSNHDETQPLARAHEAWHSRGMFSVSGDGILLRSPWKCGDDVVVQRKHVIKVLESRDATFAPLLVGVGGGHTVV